MPSNSSDVNNLPLWKQAVTRQTGLLSSDPEERRSRYAELTFINKDLVDHSALEQCSKKAHWRYEDVTCSGYFYADWRGTTEVIDTMLFHYVLEAGLPFCSLPSNFYRQALAAMDIALEAQVAPTDANSDKDLEVWRIYSEAAILLMLATRNESEPCSPGDFPLQRERMSPSVITETNNHHEGLHSYSPAFRELGPSPAVITRIDTNKLIPFELPLWENLSERHQHAIDEAIELVRVGIRIRRTHNLTYLSESAWVDLLYTLARRFSQRLPCNFDLSYPVSLWQTVSASRHAVIYLHQLKTTDLNALTREEWRGLTMAILDGWMGSDLWETTEK
jgi:hypothetical protein